MTEDARFGLARHVRLPGPLRLDGGALLSPVEIGYETYGTLNADRSNAVLICHALTGDQHVASPHPVTGKPGWWARMVGPGKPVDPPRHFIICTNVIGSCMGSSGPAAINPATGRHWGMAFPVITIRDMVRAQALLLDHLGIATLAAVIGGSMGGMQALSWPATFPDRVRAAVVIASTARHSAQNIAFHEVGRQAIMADVKWRGGEYYETGDPPAAGLAVARMAAHITYLSEAGLTEKFGRRLQQRPDRPDGAISFGFDGEFLSLHHARDRLFRSRGGAWRAFGQRLSRHQGALLSGQFRYRLALSDPGLACDRTRAQRGGCAGQLRGVVEPLRP
jgi:homoserine O-acetyltransferase